MECRMSFQRAIPFTSPAMFHTAWKPFCQRTCSIPSVRRATITWQWTKKLARVRCNCSTEFVRRAEIESALRIVSDPKHDLSTRMMCGCLLFGCNGLAQRQNPGHGWLDLSRVD